MRNRGLALRQAMLGHGHRYPRQALDGFEIGPFARIAKRDGIPSGARTRGAADAVHIAFRFVRQLIIDDVRDPRYVDAPRGDIGGDEDTCTAAAECVERTHPRILRLVPVQRFR